MQQRFDDLIQQAERVTGLRDWGGEQYFDREFRELLKAMLYSLEHESALTDQGRRGAELRLAAALEARLKLISDRARWPQITREQIVRPMFILGLPRSGSTFLHNLMAQDPANRVPQTWEMMLPSPPPTPTDRHADSRIARSESILTAMGLLHPDILALHPFGARQPEECHLMMEIMLLGDNLPACWRMPTFNKQRAATDLLLGYRTHRMVLQNLQFRHRGERVLLKNPGHVFYLPLLLSVYPDALLVLTHRDPAKVIPSVAALLVAMRKASSNDVAPREKIAMGNLRAFANGLTQTIEFRQQPGMNERFCDVNFQQLICNPIATVESLYAHFRIELSGQAREAMRRWLDDPVNHTPKGRHMLADCGLDEARVDDAFHDYMLHYGVARER
jgi:Sulfotransferase family